MIAQVVCAAQRAAGVPGFDSQQLQIFCWFFDVHGNFAWDCWAGSLGTFFFSFSSSKTIWMAPYNSATDGILPAYKYSAALWLWLLAFSFYPLLLSLHCYSTFG
jgi:hypothetical protein